MARTAWLVLHIRTVVWSISILWAITVLIFIVVSVPPSSSRYIQLSRIYADTAGMYLYLTLLIGPLTHYFQGAFWTVLALKARRAVGTSVFLFGVLHSATAFLLQLGGFAGLSYLSARYLLAMALGFDALLLLGLLTATSPDFIVKMLGSKLWKVIHRMVYLIAILILFHIVLLGSRFADLHSPVAVSSFIAISILWLLECNRIDSWLSTNVPKLSSLRISMVLGCVLVVAVGIFMQQNRVNPYSLSGHDGHYEFENRVGLDGTHHVQETE